MSDPVKARAEMVKNLKGLFYPKSVAIIGASRRPESVGHALLNNFIMGGYTGVVYPVNPKAQSIMGIRCYPSVLDIPDPVELAVIAVPAAACVEAFKDSIKKGIKGAVVISAGFKEVGEAGLLMEKELARLSLEHKIPLIGPNCLGVINADPASNLNATFARSMPKRGKMAVITQSGALGTAILDYAKGINSGFSKFISMGNKASVTELELVEYLGQDEDTDVILMYLEDLSHPREMIDLCNRITGDTDRPKPILAIKSGRTLQGAKAASSHTGSLAGSDDVYTAIFSQGGILRVDSVEDLFDFAKAFGTGKLPKKDNVAILTNAGGPGIMTTDACVRYNLNMSELSDKTKAELKKILPAAASIENPVDILGDAQHDRYGAAMKIILKDPKVAALLVLLTPQAMTDITETAEEISRIAVKSKKPVLTCFMGIVDVSPGEAIVRKWNIPHYRFPESAAKSLAAMAQYTAWINRQRTQVRRYPMDNAKIRLIIDGVRKDKRRHLTQVESFELLGACGFNVQMPVLCPTPEAAGEEAQRMGYPVAIKISSPDIIHKVDVGGVDLHLRSKAEVIKSVRRMFKRVKTKVPKADIRGVVVQKMAISRREVILGVHRDARFGPIVMFGQGGTYVETLKDVTFRIAPIKELSAYRMIFSIRSHKMFDGIRGDKPADVKTMAEYLQRISQLSVDFPEIEELDVNPLVVYEKNRGCLVLDARVILSEAPELKS